MKSRVDHNTFNNNAKMILLWHVVLGLVGRGLNNATEFTTSAAATLCLFEPKPETTYQAPIPSFLQVLLKAYVLEFLCILHPTKMIEKISCFLRMLNRIQATGEAQAATEPLSPSGLLRSTGEDRNVASSELTGALEGLHTIGAYRI